LIISEIFLFSYINSLVVVFHGFFVAVVTDISYHSCCCVVEKISLWRKCV